MTLRSRAQRLASPRRRLGRPDRRAGGWGAGSLTTQTGAEDGGGEGGGGAATYERVYEVDPGGSSKNTPPRVVGARWSTPRDRRNGRTERGSRGQRRGETRLTWHDMTRDIEGREPDSLPKPRSRRSCALGPVVLILPTPAGRNEFIWNQARGGDGLATAATRLRDERTPETLVGFYLATTAPEAASGSPDGWCADHPLRSGRGRHRIAPIGTWSRVA